MVFSVNINISLKCSVFSGIFGRPALCSKLHTIIIKHNMRHGGVLHSMLQTQSLFSPDMRNQEYKIVFLIRIKFLVIFYCIIRYWRKDLVELPCCSHTNTVS